MHRREFLEAMLGATAVGTLEGCGTPAATRAPVSARARGEIGAAEWTASRRFVPTSAGRIAHVERGGGEAALFLHGFPLSGFQWRGALARLSDRRRCIAPDLLGLGFTEVAAGQPLDAGAQAAMLATFLDALAIPSVDLVGSDSGGAVAQLFATRHPARVRTMLLTNCDVEPDSPPPAVLPVIALARVGALADRWFGRWVKDRALARSPEGLGGMTFTDPANLTDEAIDLYLAPLVSSPERKAQVHDYTLALEPNPLAGIEAALRQCLVPTRIVWGTGDTIFSQESPDYLHRILPASRGIRRVQAAKLFFPEEFPDLITEEARKLWAA